MSSLFIFRHPGSLLTRLKLVSTFILLLTSAFFLFHAGIVLATPATDAAKEEAAKVAIKDFLNENAAQSTIPAFGADVTELKDLFSKGQGNLLVPGGDKAEGCLSKNAPDCQAVQVIYDTHLRPGRDESEFDGILSDRDHLLQKVPSLPSGGDEICETVTTVRPPQTDFAVCEETQNASTQSCFEGWIEKLDVSTLFACVARTGQKLRVECLADYVHTSQDYTCLHAPLQSCSVGEVVSVQSDYRYRCRTQKFLNKTYRCNRYLEVVGYAGCQLGSFFEAKSETSSHLGQDACNGGDVIELKYQCSEDLIPKIRLETNVKNEKNFSFEVQASDFESEYLFSNCKGVWKGRTRCTGVNCTSEIQMDIYTNPKNWTFSGTLKKNFSFQRTTDSVSADKWRVTCVSEDGSVIEEFQ